MKWKIAFLHSNILLVQKIISMSHKRELVGWMMGLGGGQMDQRVFGFFLSFSLPLFSLHKKLATSG